MYGQGPFNAALAYQTITVGDAGTGDLGFGGGVLTSNDKLSAWKLAGGYTIDMFQINAIFERTSNTIANANGGSSYSQNNWYVAGKYNFTPSDAVKLAYTAAGSDFVGSDGAKQWSVGYDHNLSKHSTVYALYTKLTNDSLGTYNLGNTDASPMGAATVGNANSDPSAFVLGMKHAF
jgi:predicted porin